MILFSFRAVVLSVFCFLFAFKNADICEFIVFWRIGHEKRRTTGSVQRVHALPEAPVSVVPSLVDGAEEAQEISWKGMTVTTTFATASGDYPADSSGSCLPRSVIGFMPSFLL